MTKNIFNYLLIGILAFGLSSCSDDTEESTITNVPFTIASVDSGASFSESSRTVTVNFQLDEAQIVATKVRIAVDPLRTTATEGEDFLFQTTTVNIPAYVRNGSFTYEILEDLDAEGDETIVFTVSGVNEPFGASNSLDYTATIRDSIYNTLMLTFDWDGVGIFLGDPYPLCGNVDLDVYVVDDMGNDQGIYDAATGACPEVMIVTDAWADGEYILATNMYENGFDSLFIMTDYPITVTAIKGGVFKQVFVPEDIWNSEDEDFVNDGNGAFKELMIFEKSGNTYTIKKADGTVLAQGLSGQPHPGKVPSANTRLKR